LDLALFRTRISFATGLKNTAGNSEQVLIDGYVNEAVVQFLVETKCHIKKFAVQLQADQAWYDLDDDMLAIKELWIESESAQNVPLQPVEISEIIRRQTLGGGVGAYPTVYALEGQNLLAIDPAANSSSDELHGLYVPRPTSMSSGSHTPSTATHGNIPEEFHPVLQSYAMAKVTADDDKSIGKIPKEHQEDWDAGVIRARVRLNKKAGVFLAPARPGRKRIIPRTPGTDIRW